MKTTLQILLTTFWIITNVSNASAQSDTTLGNVIGEIDKTVAEVEAFRSKHKDKQKKYVIKEHNNSLALVEVHETNSSDETEASYFLLYDEQGRFLSHSEVPTSISGDWYMERTHYFDNDGRTIMFKNYSYHYNSGCTYLLNVTTRYYFDSQFKMIKKSTEYTDKDNKPIANPAKCEEYGTKEKDSEVMQPYYANIKKRIERNLVAYKELRIKRAQTMKEWKESSEQRRLQWAKEEEEYDRLVQGSTSRREFVQHCLQSQLYQSW